MTYKLIKVREMEYKTQKHDPIIIAEGVSNGYEFIIVSYGTHPCAYIVLPPQDRYFKVHYDYLTVLNAHGGVTFSDNELHNVIQKDIHWIIGWDYAHAGDYVGYMPMSDDHRWTVDEIAEDVKRVTDKLKEANNKIVNRTEEN